ncbi:cold-shock protein [Bradyrhizobium sp. GCM10027634]|uniref:cold-shock protein n=1 Tax=unclassified Bradyrhizobium TaxID=2631580 RepID=UPI00188AD013|nr:MULTISPECIES: cold shock domain-containing protein [unclassified Bradyrhizobium]MDN5006158.1 cold shock domain-containing protein [Bradyrhizobium sp. WYCCWR 12677]QOZ45107.1 cold-shock protein [Bradyrhizobium sp. CCBAU 53340]
MKIGHVKKWNAERGFGFISTDGHDVFCHVSALPSGVDSLDVGQHVGFEIEISSRTGKPQAANVRTV